MVAVPHSVLVLVVASQCGACTVVLVVAVPQWCGAYSGIKNNFNCVPLSSSFPPVVQVVAAVNPSVFHSVAVVSLPCCGGT